MHFPVWKIAYFDWIFTEICSKGPILQHTTIGSDNGLAANRRQAIIWTDDGLVYWRIHVSLGLNEFRPPGVVLSLYKYNTFRVRAKVNFQMWYYFPCLPFVLFVYHSTTYTHQDLLHPVFVLHGLGPHRHRWGPPLGSAQCYISNVCFIHISCHHLHPSGSPPSGVLTPWSWPSQTPVRPSTGECSVLYF